MLFRSPKVEVEEKAKIKDHIRVHYQNINKKFGMNNIETTISTIKEVEEKYKNSFNIFFLSEINPVKDIFYREMDKKLKKEKLVKSEKTKTVENIFLIRDERFIQLKRAYNIISIQESGLINLLRDKYEEPEAVVLFGSYSKGEDTSKSDIDVAIITKKHLDLDLNKFEKILRRKINIYEIQLIESEKEFINSLANGIVIYGYLKFS